MYFFIKKKVKDNMSPVSSWQYPSCFRKGQIRQLLRTLTAYFYVSSSSLVVWAVDGQRGIHRIPNHFTIFVALDISKITSEKKKKKPTSIYIIFKKFSWFTFHFIVCMCIHRKGEWSREGSKLIHKDTNLMELRRLW